MAKKGNNSTEKSIPIRMASDYYAFSFKQKPMSKAGLQQLILDGITWAFNNKNEALKTSQFFRERGFWDTDIVRFCKDPDFKAGYEQMKMIIGDNREIGALKKKLDANIVLRSMHRYDPEWKEIDEHHAQLRKNEDQQPSQIHVHIDKTPDTDIVPKKGK